MTVATEMDAVVEELRHAPKLLLTTHENPDGDALGSLLGMHGSLEQLGKDVLMFMSPGEFPLPREYGDLPLETVVTTPPEDMDERVAVFLDCGNIDRMPVDFLQREGVHIVNIDHHHDNTRFGTLNLVVPDASCTAEIVYDLGQALGVELTPGIATALYIGLVTDTGRFSYENTGPAAHRMAAELIDAGVEVHEVSRRLYENLPFTRVTLLARALSKARLLDDGRVAATALSTEDFEAVGADESDAEGIVDHLRAVEGTAVACFVREHTDEGRQGLRKVSLRSVDGHVDVSRIARSLGGGGHRQAAGATTELPLDALLDRVTTAVREQL